MREQYDHREDAFREKLAEYGLSLGTDGGRLEVRREPVYDFNDVKALDLHHLSYDFPTDVRVSRLNVDRFVDMANRRFEACSKARDYLIASHQERNVRFLPEYDVTRMKEFADRISVNGVLGTQRTKDDGKFKRSRTIRLDQDYKKDIDLIVRTTVDSTRFELENG